MLRRRRHAGIANDDERLGHDHADVPLLAGLRDVHAFQRGMIAHRVGRIAVRRRPHQLTLVEVDADDLAVRRLDDRQTLYGRAESTAAARRSGAASAGRCRKRLKMICTVWTSGYSIAFSASSTFSTLTP